MIMKSSRIYLSSHNKLIKIYVIIKIKIKINNITIVVAFVAKTNEAKLVTPTCVLRGPRQDSGPPHSHRKAILPESIVREWIRTVHFLCYPLSVITQVGSAGSQWLPVILVQGR